MAKYKKKDFHCGSIISSHCVEYEGDPLKSVDKALDQCDLNVTEAIENIDKELKKFKDGLDVKKLTKLCISSIDKEDSIVIVINKLIAKICDQEKEIADVKSKLEQVDVLSALVDINSSCLSGGHCATDQTLKSFLMKLVSEMCSLKEQINGSSNSNLYQP